MDQWEREIAKFAPWMRVVQHHGAARTTLPAVLERNHVVITSYNIVSNEYAEFEPSAAKPAKAKPTTKKAKNPEDGFIDDSDDEIAKFLEKRKPAPARKTKRHCALFEVQWWRIVLGLSLCLAFMFSAELVCRRGS
jgi:SNF2 family DNA or RNA helicase